MHSPEADAGVAAPSGVPGVSQDGNALESATTRGASGFRRSDHSPGENHISG